MTYIMLKQILHRYVPGKKFVTPEVWQKHSYPKLNHLYSLSQKSQMVNHIGDGEESDLAP